MKFFAGLLVLSLITLVLNMTYANKYKNKKLQESNYSAAESSFIIEEREIYVMKENSLYCDSPGYLCPFGFTCKKIGLDYKCLKGSKYHKESCTGEAGVECEGNLICQKSEKLVTIPHTGVVRIKDHHSCEVFSKDIRVLPKPKNQEYIKDCNFINHVCPIGYRCIKRNFEYFCEIGRKSENEQCLAEEDYCEENTLCMETDKHFENGIGKKIFSGNLICQKNDSFKLFLGYKYFFDECEIKGKYNNNTCMFGSYCSKREDYGNKLICLRGKKTSNQSCDPRIINSESDCAKGLECKCEGTFFRSCTCEKTFRTDKNKLETKKYKVNIYTKKLGR